MAPSRRTTGLPDDLIAISGEGIGTTREQKLLDILNALAELAGSHEDDKRGTASLRQEIPRRSSPTTINLSQTPGATAFNELHMEATALDMALCNIANNSRRLGGSIGIITACYRLHERLARILLLFRKNTAELFPGEALRTSPELRVGLNPTSWSRRTHENKYSRRFRHALPDASDNVDFEDFPDQFERLAEDLKEFLDCLDDFPSFTDRALHAELRPLLRNLEAWAYHFRTYESTDIAVRKYLHALSSELGWRFSRVASSLPIFVRNGIPMIEVAQKRANKDMSNLSQVAIFFSAVTATTLQYSYLSTSSPLQQAVNSFWFTSLVFSTAAAINSLLGMAWKQALYRSPAHRVPFLVLIWLRRSPLVFLVLSVACFFVGLILFAYSSHQHAVTSTLTVVFSALSCFGLAAVSAWFGAEHWVFTEHNGRKCLADALYDIKLLLSNEGVVPLLTSYLTEREVPVLNGTAMGFIKDGIALIGALSTIWPLRPIFERRKKKSGEAGSNVRWTSAVRLVMMPNTPIDVSPPDHEPPPRRKRTLSSEGLDNEPPIMQIAGWEVSKAQPAHSALVRNMDFSPDGKSLATASWDKSCFIYNVEGGTFTSKHRLLQGGNASQVAWAPNGELLLVKLNRTIKVWSKTGLLLQTILRQRSVHVVVWLPFGEAFLSVESYNAKGSSEIVKYDTTGNILEIYRFNSLAIRNVAVTGDNQRMLCIGVSTINDSDLQESNGVWAEKQIVVYNLEKKCIEYRVPVLYDVRDITLTRRGDGALVSYEQKGLPQLWKMEIDGEKDVARLNLRHTYVSAKPVDFSGPSYFGGRTDEYVLCSGKDGDIYIWDRDTATLLDHIDTRSAKLSGELTCIASNSTIEPFMFATGCHNGAVRIWTIPRAALQVQGLPSPTTDDDGSLPRLSTFASNVTETPTIERSTRIHAWPGMEAVLASGRESDEPADSSREPPARKTVAFTPPRGELT